jgi:Peptidase_C39 like family
MRPDVPWLTQYASPELIESFSYGGRPRADDPRWRESGAPDAGAYAAWCARWCGMTCLRMALLARDGTAPSLYELAQECAGHGGYSDEPGAPGGLIYRPFAGYVRERHALAAEVITDLGPARLVRELDAGALVIASVHPEIRRPDRDPPGTGGHLVLVTGHDRGAVRFHNPSGHRPDAVVATLPLPVFDRFAARRGIALTPWPDQGR